MIKPYFETKLGKLYHGDCLEVMEQFPDNHFDLCLTDPPYGVGIKYDCFEDNEENLIKLIDNVMPIIIQKSKTILITPGQKNLFNYPTPSWILAWVNMAGTGFNKWGMTCWHPILFYGDRPKKLQHDVIVFNGSPEQETGHPVPKPLGLWAELLEKGLQNKNSIVIDPFIGSGTTGIICEKNNIKWIGIDVSEKYCAIAKERILSESQQGKLFETI